MLSMHENILYLCHKNPLKMIHNTKMGNCIHKMAFQLVQHASYHKMSQIGDSVMRNDMLCLESRLICFIWLVNKAAIVLMK